MKILEDHEAYLDAINAQFEKFMRHPSAIFFTMNVDPDVIKMAYLNGAHGLRDILKNEEELSAKE